MKHTLLVCTVGGTPEAVAKAVLHWAPERVLFVPSEQTRSQVDAVLRRYAEDAGRPLAPGCYRVCPVEDAEDLTGCLRTLQELGSEIEDWAARGGSYEIVADFTAGTKSMAAALALQARRWPCRFSYVGGSQRTKEGVGVVETGSERVVHSANPWDALGYQAIEDAVTVFNHGGFAAAAHLLDHAIKNADRPEVKRELATLKALIDAYAAWDRFDHGDAGQRFKDVLKNRHDIEAIFANAQPLITRLERHQKHVARLAEMREEPSAAWVADLLRNAQRRAEEKRFDDAVARLYRAFEALAQIRLREQHGIGGTKSIPLETLPQALRDEWETRARDGAVSVGLQDAYRLLQALDDELGQRFLNTGLAGETSPLSARNQSILAHGFDPIRDRVYQELCSRLVSLGEFEKNAEPWALPAVR